MAETRGPAIITGNFVPFFLSLPFFLARLVSRGAILGKFFVDDYVLLAGWIASVGMLANSVVQVKYGAGRHQQDIPVDTISSFLKSGYADRQLYIFSTGMLRSSLCIMSLRIFGTSLPDRIFLWFINILTLTTTVAFMAFNLFNCQPIAMKWDFTVQGHCADDTPGFWANIAVSLLTNVCLLIFSAIKINTLQMHRRQKYIMLGTIGIGWLIVVAIVVRAVRIAHVIADHSDAAWRTFDTSIWSAVEINVSVFCVSAMAMKPFVKKVAPAIMSWLSSGTGGTYGKTTGAVGKTTQGKSQVAQGTRIEEGVMNKEEGIVKVTAVTIREDSDSG
ncbi:hypothetical protein KVT40_005498 [Elsinoe batatas]|uniref:Rhodopsin domain-containing protein n=1 Tax=Elsinoe batatas TaxID=2601811 RepID=A0A8K0L1N1_9PEZI|nr:hypothetical protein KVT40_005498 [Elsinoe batatas]